MSLSDNNNPYGEGQDPGLFIPAKKVRVVVRDLQGKEVCPPLEIENQHHEFANQEQNLKVFEIPVYVNAVGKVITSNPLGLYAISWTGELTTEPDCAVCTMCLIEKARKRFVFLDLDGFSTSLGNFLCLECMKENIARKKSWKRFFGRTEIY